MYVQKVYGHNNNYTVNNSPSHWFPVYNKQNESLLSFTTLELHWFFLISFKKIFNKLIDNVNEYYKEMMLYLKLKSFHHCKWRLIKNGKKLFLQVSYYATLSSDLQNNLIYHITKIRTKIDQCHLCLQID